MIDFSFPLAGWIQIIAFFAILLLVVKPLGLHIARVFTDGGSALALAFAPVESAVYRLAGIDAHRDMSAKEYAACVAAFSMAGFALLYFILTMQTFPDIAPDLAFNIAISFITNTNWQAYIPETTLSATTQMVGLAVQNFLSASVGLAVAMALIRGLTRENSEGIGNFWVDLVRGVLYVLLPLAFILAVLLLTQGVPQTFGDFLSVSTLENGAAQIIQTGAVASQEAIKQLGTNGGGYYNANSAHPFENPTPLSNFLELLAILSIPAALTAAFGKMVGDAREGRVLLAAMLILFVPLTLFCAGAEQAGNPLLAQIGVDQAHGNMEGKEVRFGVVGSALWAGATTAAANGSTNAALDSFTPLGGLVPLTFIQLGEVVFGGVGSGLYGILIYVLFSVFIAGLMIGRTPEYLGKKIGVFEMKMAALFILIPALATLGGAALAVLNQAGRSAIGNPGAQGFSEILYAFSSAANNNGSAFAGLTANVPFYNVVLGLCMLAGRFGTIFPVLAIAGASAEKKKVPVSSGTLRTTSPLFTGILVAVMVLIGLLTYLPALALGPIAAQFNLWAQGLTAI